MFARRLLQHSHSSRVPSFFSLLAPILHDGLEEIVDPKHHIGQKVLRPSGADGCAILRLVDRPMRSFLQGIFTTARAGTNSVAVAVNSVTNQVYAVGSGSNDTTASEAASNRSSPNALAISREHRRPLALTQPYPPISRNVTTAVSPVFSFVRSVGRSVLIVR
jgi:hypothetical protein